MPRYLLELRHGPEFQNILDTFVVNEQHFKSTQKVGLSQKLLVYSVDSARYIVSIDIYWYVGFYLGWFWTIYISNPEELIPIIHCD